MSVSTRKSNPWSSDLMVDHDLAEELKKSMLTAPSLTLTPRQLCDIELLLNGGFSPLNGYLDKKSYESVIEKMTLPCGAIWPIPINLDVSEETANQIEGSERIALRSQEGTLVAVLRPTDLWQPDKKKEAEGVFGTESEAHPGVKHLFHESKTIYVGGTVQGVELPIHYDFQDLRLRPNELKKIFKNLETKAIVAFQTRNPMHRAHQEITLRAAKELNAHLLIHPVVGMTKPGDIDYFTRVRCYQKLLKHYPNQSTTLALLPLAMRMGGPREAVWHALIRKNYGCTHFIVGRDHAGPGKDENGKDFYGPYDAQELVAKHEAELGIKMVPFKMMVYRKDKKQYWPIDKLPEGCESTTISGTELRSKLQKGELIPEWFTYPEISDELVKRHPPRSKQGFTVFLTGLSGSGKSTIANALRVRLMESEARQITLLDGDIVRTHLSSELGFSKEHRSINVRRIGYVASEITKNGGIAICAPIAPYEQDRQANRDLISPLGGYIELHVSTPLAECERRDRKGLYAKARQGLIKGMTGIDDPYEAPKNPELRIDTSKISVEEAIHEITTYLREYGYSAFC